MSIMNPAADLATLVALARDSSTSARSELAGQIGDLMSGQGLTDAERGLAADILIKLLSDTEMSVRLTLARHLAADAGAPIELVLALANDTIEVARPVLLESQILRDADLIEVVRHRTRGHQLAISMRRNLSENVSDALVETRDADVVVSVLSNRHARIRSKTLETLVEMSQTLEPLQKPLLDRHDLDPALAGRMYGWVSSALKHHIILNFDVDPTKLDKAITDTLAEILTDHATLAAKGNDSRRLAEALAGRTPCDPQMLLRVLRAGDVRLFEALFARRTGLPIKVARRCLYEQGGRPLAAACRLIGFDKANFAALFLLARSSREGDKSVDPRELPTILSYFDTMTPDKARQTLIEWRTALAAEPGRTVH